MAEDRPLPFLDGGIAQIAFVVEDLESTVERYHRDLGIGPWHFYTYAKPFVKEMSYRGRPADYAMRVALTYFGATRIELIQMLHGDTVYADFVMEHGFGVQHLGVLVDDMDHAIEQARAAGYSVIMDGSGFGIDGDGHFAYLDTERDLGVTYELIQRPRQKHPPEKVYPPHD